MTSDELDVERMLVGPDEGARIPVLDMWHKVSGAQLDGGLLIMEGVIAPGQLVVPHTHTREDECAYVLSGVLTYQIGDEVRTAFAGSYVAKPRGIPHAFWNASPEPARVMELHLPATFERFYDELAEIFAQHHPGSAPWREAFDRLNARYGVIQHWDRAAEIAARYNVGASRS
jgi:quercetin dioxygenase-like cupin family protein